MTNPRQSTYRTALHVSPERIARLGDGDLNELMRDLLRAQAYRCKAPVSEICVNTEGNAKDDGCDGWSPRPASVDAWLGGSDTCWQFKAGKAGEPAQLQGEVIKRIPQETLAAGGRFVVVASASKNGKKGENDRRQKLRDEAQKAGLPVHAIEVFGSERLANWCNLHPAVAARWAGRPGGLWTLNDWRQCEKHRVAWQSTIELEKKIAALRCALDFETGSLWHLHIKGQPGVGKTRLALELCRGADWRGAVVYVQQACDVRLAELLDEAAAEADVRLLLVADEVQAEQLLPLRDSVGRADGRVRLITIGHSKTPDSTRIRPFAVEPLEPQPMRAVIKGWHPAMPPEHVEFVVRFADGYVRLALLAADAVARDRSLNVHALLDIDGIRSFLDRMIGDGNRRSLHVVAVLDSVGWTEDRQAEGEAVAKHLGLDWNEVRAQVEDFQRRLGIVPRGGRYRYMSPTPLGIYLAVDAWNTYPDLLKTLPDKLPTEEAREAYYSRLQAIASNTHGRQFARDELSRFFRLNDFVDASATKRWSALAAADPDLTASNIRRALADAMPEERRRIADQARGQIVWTLGRMAWRSTTFHDAMIALALLAEAENETWANNATMVFVERFYIIGGATAVPYLERLQILEDLVDLGRTATTRLVIKALTQIKEEPMYRVVSPHISDELPEPEWRPVNEQERLVCMQQAIGRLNDIAKKRSLDFQDDLVASAKDLSWLLRVSSLRVPVIGFFDSLRTAYPEARETLRQAVADVLYHEKKYAQRLSAAAVAEIEALHHRFEDVSLAARIRQFVGWVPDDPQDQIDLTPLATEILGQQDVLAQQWPWLTSGEAANCFGLGVALATVDANGDLENVLSSLVGRGPDGRILAGYVRKRRSQLGTAWFEGWLVDQLLRDPADVPLLFEITSRCGATENTARLLIATIRYGNIEPRIVGQLEYGSWSEDLPAAVIADVVRAMSDRGHKEIAISILERRLKTKPEETSDWDDLALDLVTSPELVRSETNVRYHWMQVARNLVSKQARKIAAAIFRVQASRKTGEYWFLSHSVAPVVLSECAERDPAGVWEELQPYFSSSDDAFMFSIGFPIGILDLLPVQEIMEWVARDPEERAAVLARFVNVDLKDDNSLASQLLGVYGDNEEVAGEFSAKYLSGVWTGSASELYANQAEALESISKSTSLPKLRRWAAATAREPHRDAEREKQREEEEKLRGR